MRGREARRKRTSQSDRSILRFDAPLLIFLLVGWLLIFATATLGLQRDTYQWLSVNLAPQVYADYSVDAINAPKLARVKLDIIEAVKQDAQAREIKPIPTLAVVVPEITPTATPTPSPTPASPGVLTVSAGGPYSGDEGSPISLAAGNFNSALNIVPGTVTYRWDLDSDELYDDAEGISTSVIFNDEGEYPIAVQASDLLGRVATDRTIVRVNNLPPIVDIGPDQYTNEAEKIEFSATANDPGNDVLLYEWDFGDGKIEENNTLRPKHTYRDDGDYLVRLRVRDNDGGFTEDLMVVHVGNLPPIVEVAANRVTNEGSTIAFSGTAFDPAGEHDTLTYAWDLNYDGRTFTPDVLGSTASTTYSDGPANIVAALLVQDEDGGKTIETVDVTVNNVAPTIVSVTNSGPVDEGSLLSLQIKATDIGRDTLTYAFDWQNDGSFDAVAQSGNASNIWYNQGDYTVGIRVDDGDGGQVFTTTTVSALNVAPTAVAQVLDTAYFEGSSVTFNGIDSSDPGINDLLTYRWNFGDGGTANGIEVSHIYVDNDVYSATLTVTDDSQAADTDSIALSILNANPVADAGSDLKVNEDVGVSLAFNGTATDPGADDLTYAWDFDYNQKSFNPDATGRNVIWPNLNLDGPKVYMVALRVRDDDYPYSTKDGGEVGEAIDTLKITVKNVAPKNVDARGPYSGFEMDDITLTAGDAKDIPDDELIYEWDFDYDGDNFHPDKKRRGQTVTKRWSNEAYYNDVHYSGVHTYTAMLRVSDEDGGESFDATEVVISNAPPTAKAGDRYTTTVNIPVTLSGAGSTDPTNNPLTYRWDFGDGSNGTGITATHTYLDDGTHIATLQVKDPWGATGTDTAMVIVENLPPTAVAVVSPTTTFEGSLITFDGRGSSDPGLLDTLTYQWDFGDGGTASTITATHTYADNGVYTTTLTVTDDGGDSDSESVAVTIWNADPMADAGSDRIATENVRLDLTSSATDPGSADTLNYHWDFNYDGTNFDEESTGNSVSTTYLDGPNVYTVALRVRDDDYPYPTGGGGEIGEDIVTLQVTVNNAPPIVEAGGPYNGLETYPITMTGTAADAPLDLPGLTYEWDLNYDGTVFTRDLTDTNPITNIWNTAGVYTTALRVTDKDGGQGLDTARVIISNAPPRAEAGGPYTTTVNIPVTLSGAGSTDPTNDPLTYRWDFGDGSNGTGVTANHTYLDDGTYIATLQVDDGRGGIDTDTATVTVENLPPTAVAVVSPTTALEGSLLTFDGTGSNDPGLLDTLTYQWGFGDGGTATGITATHTYADDRVYTATLTVTDDAGASDADTVTVTIWNANPAAEAGPDQVTTEAMPLTLTGTATDPGLADSHTFAWDFNYDGATFDVEATGQTVTTPTLYLDGSAVYTVALRVRDDDYPAGGGGEIGEAIDTLQLAVNNAPPAVAVGGPYATTVGIPTTLSGSGTDIPADPLTYGWDFDYDGVTFDLDGTGQTVIHTWTITGTYTVALRVADDDGGFAMATTTVDVGSPPIANAGGPYLDNEGSPFTLDGSGSSDPDGDPLTYTWDLDNDGTFETPGPIVTNTWNDNGVFTVTLRVEDGRGGIATDGTTVTVFNVPPNVVAGIGPNPAFEGSPVTFDGSGSSDPGANDTLTYEWDFGDGSSTASGINVTHTYTDDGVYTATLTVTDDDGAAGTATFSVTILNANPTAGASAGPNPAPENTPVTFDGSGSSDPGNDTLTYEWDFDYDGVTFDVDMTGQNVSTTYPDGPATYTVVLRVRDDDYPYPTGGGGEIGEAIDTLQVTISNTPPTASAGGSYTTMAAVPITLMGSGTDVPADTLTYRWDLNNDNDFETPGQTVMYTWTTTGTYTVTLQVDDGDGGSDTDTTTVQVNSLLPLAWLASSFLVLRKKVIALRQRRMGKHTRSDPRR